MPPVSTPGGELFDRIVARGHYSEQDASKLIRVIVEALQAIHSVGILHRWEGLARSPYLTRIDPCRFKSSRGPLGRIPSQPMTLADYRNVPWTI